MDAEKLKEICLKHVKWLNGEEGGERANLRGSNLSGSNLLRSNLSGSNLLGSDLSGSDLSGSNLSGSNLSGSDLSDSDLSGSNLSGSDLRGSNLSGSDLRGSNLSGSNLPHKYISIGPIGSRNDITIYSYEYDVIRCGCFKGSIKEFAERVKSTYQEGHKYRIEYDAAIEMIEKLRPLYDKK